MPNTLSIWWLGLCTVAAINVVAWSYAARELDRRAADLPADILVTRRLVLWLSAAYVLGCGFRSVLPMIDVPRICLHDTPISRILIGRSVATLAEVCFVAQWALLLREAGAATGRRFVNQVAYTLVPLTVVAETFSWLAVLATNNLLHAIENSLWTAGAALALVAFVSLRGQVDAAGRHLLGAAIAGTAAYVVFMVLADVPMYLARWRADLAAGHQDLPLLQGLAETLQRCRVVRETSAWRQDIPWLTLYFSVAVWVSIALAHVPPLRVGTGPARLPAGRAAA
jgi:hypothetical protein